MKMIKKKNIGCKQRAEEKEINDSKRGPRIPLGKEVIDEKTKQKKRSRIKADLKKTMKNEE